MTLPQIQIAGRPVGTAHPPYVVAELSANHNGSLQRALELIDAAAEARADAVKLQTYTPDTITLDSDGPGFVIEQGLWQGRRLYELYAEAHTPWDWHPALFERAALRGLACFSSPFDLTAVRFLEELGTPAHKIASFELVDLPLVRAAAVTGKPVVLSTGMATREEIADAVEAARAAGPGEVMLLHCVSGYPTPLREAAVRSVPMLAADFGVPVGFSDHTVGHAAAAAAVALGASMIEKHLVLDRQKGGPDAAFSAEPDDLARLVRECRDVWEALGEARYGAGPAEQANRALRRSLYAVEDIAAGEPFTSRNVRSVRPGRGLPPKRYEEILGRVAAQRIAAGTPLAEALLGPRRP